MNRRMICVIIRRLCFPLQLSSFRQAQNRGKHPVLYWRRGVIEKHIPLLQFSVNSVETHLPILIAYA